MRTFLSSNINTDINSFQVYVDYLFGLSSTPIYEILKEWCIIADIKSDRVL